MLTDPIADFLTQIKNGYMAHKEKIVVSYSNQREKLAKLLEKEGYVENVEKFVEKNKQKLAIKLIYKGKTPKLTNLVRMSKPGRRLYVKKDKIPNVLSGLGIVIISTPLGFSTGGEARKKGVGGELICKLW